MLLLTGPAGSGKTFTVLEGLREALRRHDAGVRLLVPTATMARHLQNLIAREGFVLRPGLIQTLNRFIEAWTADLRHISSAMLNLLVEGLLDKLGRPEFARVLPTPGLAASLARTIEECASAGLDARTLARNLPSTPLGEPFLAVYRGLERELAARRLALRKDRLDRAAAVITKSGLQDIHTIWLDGFATLSDPELALVQAAARHASVTVTLPADDIAGAARQRLRSMGAVEQFCRNVPGQPARALAGPATIEREADEIARRILEQSERGRPFREMGVIVRNDPAYVPLLRMTFERFGIPARFYFDAPLAEHAAVRFLAGAVDAMLGGWDHAATLAVLKLAPGVGASAAMDRFDFALRARLPGRTLDMLPARTAGDERLDRLLSGFAQLDTWRSETLTPVQWAEHASTLRALYRFGRPPSVAHETAFLWRSQAAALDAFDAALDEAANAFGPDHKPVSLHEFWNVVKAVLRLTPLRVPDERRNVVHVLSPYEARQWELPVVFVCGLVEGQFPVYHSQDPFLPDAARRHLQQAGVRLRTTQDLEAEERFLYDSAVSRATSLLVLSYPRTNPRGEANLRSLFLEAEEVKAAPAIRPKPARMPAAPGPSAITSPDLLQALAQKHATFGPTSLESYMQCAFQFFGRYTLRLRQPPPRPQDRLDLRVQGGIVHKVLAEWVRERGPVDPVFDRIFAEAVETEWIPPGYRTELFRAQMLADLRRFAADTQWPEGLESMTEQEFTFAINGGPTVRGRMDRLDRTPDGLGFVIDYKYSKQAKERLTNDNLLQGPLYLMALERAFDLKPGGMFYCSLRDDVKYAGWSQAAGLGLKYTPFTPEWLDAAAQRSTVAASEIMSGRIQAAPSDPDKCRYCALRDVCRFDARAVTAAREGA